MTDNRDSSPIIIYGAPRSGTTYLNEILNKHPDVFITNESRLFVWVHRTLNELAQDDEVLFFYRGPYVEHLHAEYPALIREFYRKLAPGARYWGDKYPNYASPKNEGCLDTIATLFPEARYIHIIRDGRDVTSSLLRKGWGEFERAHHIWMRHVDIGSAFGERRSPSQYCELRYEDLIRDDVGTARQLLDFLGIDMPPSVQEFCETQHHHRSPFSTPTRNLEEGAAQSDWARLLTPEQQLVSLDLIGNHLMLYGYETEASLEELRRELRSARTASGEWETLPWEPHANTVNRPRVTRIRTLVQGALPEASTLLAVSKGDEELLDMGSHRVWHFPQTPDGRFLGFHPEDSDEVIAQLEALREKGAEYLLLPSTSAWWLDYYVEFREHLAQHYRLVAEQEDTCLIFSLRRGAMDALPGELAGRESAG